MLGIGSCAASDHRGGCRRVAPRASPGCGCSARPPAVEEEGSRSGARGRGRRRRFRWFLSPATRSDTWTRQGPYLVAAAAASLIGAAPPRSPVDRVEWTIERREESEWREKKRKRKRKEKKIVVLVLLPDFMLREFVNITVMHAITIGGNRGSDESWCTKD